MRISDWSSDVCSSDLTSDCRQSLQQSHGTYLQILDVNRNDGSIKLFNQELRLANDARSSFRWVVGANYELRDRTSVVEGKSVSVRVDFGGRRIIKKKTYNLQCHST